MSKQVKIFLTINEENKKLKAKILNSSQSEKQNEEQNTTYPSADIECTFISPISVLFFLKCYFKQKKNLKSENENDDHLKEKTREIFQASVSKTSHIMKQQNLSLPSEDDAMSAPIVSCSDPFRFFKSIIAVFPELETLVVDPMEDHVISRAKDAAIVESFVELINQNFRFHDNGNNNNNNDNDNNDNDNSPQTSNVTTTVLFRVNVDDIEPVFDVKELQEGINKLSHGFEGMMSPALDETVLHLNEIVKSQQMLLETLRSQNQDVSDMKLLKELETKFEQLPDYIKRTRQLQRDMKNINDRVDKMKRRSHKAHVNRDKQATRNASNV